MPLVCFDTHLLIWGVQGVANTGQNEQIQRTRNLLRYLRENHVPIMLPARVLAEFLTGFPEAQHESISGELQNGFMVSPFDAQAAIVSARLMRQKQDDGTIRELLDSGGVRSKINADAEIVAVAIARAANRIYSNDPGLRRFAQGQIDVREVPEMLRQQEMFD